MSLLRHIATVSGLLIISLNGAQAGKVLLLNDNFPGSSKTLYSGIDQSIRNSGLDVEEVDGRSLKSRLSAEQGPGTILVLPNGEYFPADARSALNDFLKRGNHMLAISGPALTKLVAFVNGEWVTKDLAKDCMPVEGRTIIDFAKEDIKSWVRASGSMQNPTEYKVVSTGDSEHPYAFHVDMSKMDNFEVFFRQPLDTPFRDEQTATVFWAKGTPGTPSMMIQWTEKDGAKWMSEVMLTTEWKKYVLFPDDFFFWRDGSPENRGGAGDKFNPANAEKIALVTQLSVANSERGKRQSYWISNIHAAKNPYEGLDFSSPLYESISPAFKTYTTPVYGARMVGDESITPIQTDVICPIYRSRGMGSDSVRKWRFIPFIEVLGPSGEFRGSGAHLFLNTTTEYAGSIWGFVGFSQDYLAENAEQSANLISSMINRMSNGLFLADAGSEHFGYEAGAGEVIVEE